MFNKRTNQQTSDIRVFVFLLFAEMFSSPFSSVSEYYLSHTMPSFFWRPCSTSLLFSLFLLSLSIYASSIHPSIHYVLSFEHCGGLGPTADIGLEAGYTQNSVKQGQGTERSNHIHSCSHLRFIKSLQSACFWFVGRSWSIWRTPMKTWGQHANSTTLTLSNIG